ncbi:alpha/beta fold hydrolase [Nonomuraea angiospora]|uniref:Pimeloyl-ACP methyl ester carboxylesterase n=1 Tax=Nonomuraea angiospora TaxID=46172 RepID=A0ABR9M4M8_9ACTN|nr:alpha/beta hydrolase [Nonomuraea angiospora]MBE1587819.1 pimeloyl-ACP methyl ester carboxylesterase [Nonomuraea angiospora]
MLITTASDGTQVRAIDEGQGPALLILHPGLDDGRSWGKVAALLTRSHRVVRLHRRQYRQDLPSPATISQEVQHVLAAARKIGTPVLLVGHSSGAVVALESLVAAPGTFTGAVLYEPPVVIGPPLGGPGGEINIRARQAIAAGRPGRALRIFIRDTVRLPAWVAFLSGLFVALSPRLRLLVPHQIDDNEAMDRLGVRLDAYAGIDTPVLLLGGDRSPGHLSERLDALARALPRAERVVLHGQGHSAHAAAPAKVAAAIESFTATTTG